MQRTGPSLGTVVGRGFRGRCPSCGSRGIFKGVSDLKEDCPTCGLHFEREDGYWLGSMIVIMAMVLITFAVVTAGGIALFWPDVPWTGVTIAGVAANIAVPILGYGYAKSVWQGLSWGFSPPTMAEAADAFNRRAAQEAGPSGATDGTNGADGTDGRQG